MTVPTWPEFVKMSHKERCLSMWDYLRETGSAYKDDFIMKMLGCEKYLDEVTHYETDKFLTYLTCGACKASGNDCLKCPIDWGTKPVSSDFCQCVCDGSPFREWIDTNITAIKERKIYADKVYKIIDDTWVS